MAEQTTHTLPLREEVPAKDKWHIEDIFSNDDAFTSALEACRTHIDALAAFKDHLGDSAETLCTYLSEYCSETDGLPWRRHNVWLLYRTVLFSDWQQKWQPRCFYTGQRSGSRTGKLCGEDPCQNCSIQKPDIMPPPWKPICLRTIFRQLFMTS